LSEKVPTEKSKGKTDGPTGVPLKTSNHGLVGSSSSDHRILDNMGDLTTGVLNADKPNSHVDSKNVRPELLPNPKQNPTLSNNDKPVQETKKDEVLKGIRGFFDRKKINTNTGSTMNKELHTEKLKPVLNDKQIQNMKQDSLSSMSKPETQLRDAPFTKTHLG